MSALTVITRPEPIIDLPSLKVFLRVAEDDENNLLLDLVEAATAYLDGPDGMLNRSLGKQSLSLMLDGFPIDGIEVPVPPLQSVDLIRYATPDGGTMDLPAAAYRVAIPGAGPGIIRPRGFWPATLDGAATVEVQFTAGYDRVPMPIQTAIMQHVATMYENRESAGYSTRSYQPTPFAGWSLVEPYARPCFG